MKKGYFLLFFCVFGVIRLFAMDQNEMAQAVLRIQNKMSDLVQQHYILQGQLSSLESIEGNMKNAAHMYTQQAWQAADNAKQKLEITEQNVKSQMNKLQSALQTTIDNAQRDLNERKKAGEEGITQRSAEELNRINSRLVLADREIAEKVSERSRSLNDLQKRIGKEMTDHAERELEEFLKEATKGKEQTSRELKILANQKIEELKKKFDETHAAAAQAKRIFADIMLKKKQDFVLQLEKDKEKRHREKMDVEQAKIEQKKKIAALDAETRVEIESGKQKKKLEYKEKYSERLHREQIKASKERIKETFSQVADMLNDGKTVRNLALTTGLTITGILAVKHLLPIIRKKMEDALFTPPLIDDSSFTGFTGIFAKKTSPDQQLANLYFNEKLKKQIDSIIAVLRDTSKNKGYYLNYLFYGEPGTGKTATARALAYESGMNYAIMSGGNVQKLLATGKAEEKIKDVFKWAKKSKKGMLLFIDEADAFLKDPNKYAMTDELYAVLNSFLNLTGTESKDFALILSTNHPQNLPKAVLDRVGPGQFIYFGLPEYRERQRIVRHFVNKYLGRYFERTIEEGDATKPELSVITDERLKDEIIDYIARKTEGFSGRNLSYLVLAIEKMLMAGGHVTITKELVDEVVGQAVEQRKAAESFQSFA